MLTTPTPIKTRPCAPHDEASSTPARRPARTPKTPTTLSPAATPFLSSSAKRRGDDGGGGGATAFDANATTPEDVTDSLTRSIASMKRSASVPNSSKNVFGTALVASDDDDDDDDDDGGGAFSRRISAEWTEAALARERELGNVTPPPGSASTPEGYARVAARNAGTSLRRALERPAEYVGERTSSTLGDPQRAAADLTHELETALGSCKRAVDDLARGGLDADAAAAVVTHGRLSSVLLEEVTVGAARARNALVNLTAAIRCVSQPTLGFNIHLIALVPFN
jgi:hypothetical protein